MIVEMLGWMIFFPTLVVGLFAVLFGLGRVFSPGGLRRIFRGFRPAQFNLWQMMTGIVFIALLLMIFEWGYERILFVTLVCLFILAWFLRNWRDEFVFLMGLGDGDLPGRHDRLIWAAMLLLLAPIGVWFFRAYRLAHWPEPAPAAVDEGVAEGAGGAATQPA
jgi:hypothetical protein